MAVRVSEWTGICEEGRVTVSEWDVKECLNPSGERLSAFSPAVRKAPSSPCPRAAPGYKSVRWSLFVLDVSRGGREEEKKGGREM